MDYQALKAEVKAAGYVVSEGDGWTLEDQNSYTQFMHFNKGVPQQLAAYRLAFKHFVGEAYTTVEHVLEDAVEKVEEVLGLEDDEGDDSAPAAATGTSAGEGTPPAGDTESGTGTGTGTEGTAEDQTQAPSTSDAPPAGTEGTADEGAPNPEGEAAGQ